LSNTIWQYLLCLNNLCTLPWDRLPIHCLDCLAVILDWKIRIEQSVRIEGLIVYTDTNEYNVYISITRYYHYLPFMDDSLDKTQDEELLSLWASFNSLRYSSPDDMNGTGVTRSALWKDIGDVQLAMSTQDSGNGNKYITYILFLKLLSRNAIQLISYSITECRS